jgi:hypothetical protein
MVRPSRRLVAHVAVVSASLVLGVVSLPGQGRSHVDLLSSAQPVESNAIDADSATAFKRTNKKRVKADASATASAGCPGCTGNATTVQVVYMKRAKNATVDNVATAWSSCERCTSTSVSVQVIVARPSTTLVPRNRALAVNASCRNCSSTAIAYQVVVLTKNVRSMSREEQHRLQAFVDQLRANAGREVRTTTRSGRTPVAKGLDQFETLLGEAFGTSHVDGTVALRRG